MQEFLSMSVIAAALVAMTAPAMTAQNTAPTNVQTGVQSEAQPAAQPVPARARGFGAFGGGQPVQGIVTTIAAGKLTLRNDAGDSYDVLLTDTSRIMENRQAIRLADIKPGDSVVALGQVDAARKTVQAMFVNVTDAATIARAKENLGKTYITGRVAAIDAETLRLTITRTDSVSQVIAVDEGTSFQRGTRGVAADITAAGGLGMGGLGGGRGLGGGMGRQGGAAQTTAPAAPESITLAEVKVGDAVMATGSVKDGTFTALKLGVSTPGAGRGGRRGRQQPGPGGPEAPPQ